MNSPLIGRLFGACVLAVTCLFGSAQHTSAAEAHYSIEVVTVIGPAKASPNWQAWAEMVVNKLSQNEYPPFVASVTAPTGYRGVQYQISPTNLVFSTTTHSWEGNFSPSSPFNQEYGSIAWTFVKAKSIAGNDAVSLNQVVFKATSSEGSLNYTDSISSVTNTYSPTAIGIMADGTRITGGSSTQKAATVIIPFAGLHYIANSPQELADVVNYVKGVPGFKINITIELKDGDTVIGSSKVALSTTNVQNPPAATAKLEAGSGGSLTFKVEGGSQEYSYVVQMADAVTGPWHNTVVLAPGNQFAINKDNKPMQFFRIVRQ